ncbi:MAG: DUF4230 domain-containing protein [Atopobiaceae bacterium]|nr:DUF4230 domain-containing protein [Atopobiaceae bacterium]
MKAIKTFFILLLGLAIGAGGLFVYQNYFSALSWARHAPSDFEGEESTVIDLSVLQESMQKNNELSTAKYLYTASASVSDINDLSILGHPDIKVPFTDATYVFQFDGVIKVGFDLSKASVDLKGDNTVVVKLPAPMILSHETGDVQPIFEHQNFLNPLHVTEESDWIGEQKDAMEKRAEDLGIYDEARENAKVTFESLFAAAIPEGAVLEIEFED